MDIVFWFGLSTATALSLVLLLTYAPRMTAGAAVLALPLAFLSWITSLAH